MGNGFYGFNYTLLLFTKLRNSCEAQGRRMFSMCGRDWGSLDTANDAIDGAAVNLQCVFRGTHPVNVGHRQAEPTVVIGGIDKPLEELQC